jgi:hypothetical protein
MIYTTALNAVGAASAVRPTDGWGRRQPLSPAEGSPLEGERLQEAGASRGGENIDRAG